ncbi:hypothetical protein Ancab_030318 [Ancistrocladus abbreviatus]
MGMQLIWQSMSHDVAAKSVTSSPLPPIQHLCISKPLEELLPSTKVPLTALYTLNMASPLNYMHLRHRKNVANEATLSSKMTTSKLSFATLVPWMPIVSPMSASFRAGASFVPSPLRNSASSIAGPLTSTEAGWSILHFMAIDLAVKMLSPVIILRSLSARAEQVMGNQQTNGHKEEDKLENQEHEKAALNSSPVDGNEEDQVVKSSEETEDPHVQSQLPDTKDNFAPNTFAEHETHHTGDDGKAVHIHPEEKPYSEKEMSAKGDKEHVLHETPDSHTSQHSEDKQEMKDDEELKVLETELENKETKHNLIRAHNNQSPDQSHASHPETLLHGHEKGATDQLAGTEEGKHSSYFHDVSVEEKTIILEGGDCEESRDPSVSLPNEDKKTHLLDPQTKETETKDLDELPDVECKKDGSRGKEKRKPKQPPFLGSLCCGGVLPLKSDF